MTLDQIVVEGRARIEREKVRELIIKTCIEVIMGNDWKARVEAFALLRKLIAPELCDEIARTLTPVTRH